MAGSNTVPQAPLIGNRMSRGRQTPGEGPAATVGLRQPRPEQRVIDRGQTGGSHVADTRRGCVPVALVLEGVGRELDPVGATPRKQLFPGDGDAVRVRLR